MFLYCFNCGFKNEYTGTSPSSCGKCQTSFASSLKEVQKKAAATQEGTSSKGETFENSEFNSFMQGKPEPISEDEIQELFLSTANQGVRLGDLIKEGEKRAQKNPPKARKSKRK